jgi:hypothetical protein
MDRNPNDVLADAVHLDGADVLDVGCGTGDLVRWMRERGARPIGTECGPAMRSRALEADSEHADAYVDAEGQDLPFEDGSFDVVIFSASLHHVPMARIPDAIAEAHRVLRPGGTLFVSEPSVEDPEDDIFFPLIDERAERAAAQRAIDQARGFEIAQRFEFEHEVTTTGLDAMLELVVDIDSDRAERLGAHHDEIRAKFDRLGERRDDSWVFHRRNLVAVLTKLA